MFYVIWYVTMKPCFIQEWVNATAKKRTSTRYLWKSTNIYRRSMKIYRTSTNICENLRKSVENLSKSIENLRKSTKIIENRRKSIKIDENLRKSKKIYENLRKAKKIYENPRPESLRAEILLLAAARAKIVKPEATWIKLSLIARYWNETRDTFMKLSAMSKPLRSNDTRCRSPRGFAPSPGEGRELCSIDVR